MKIASVRLVVRLNSTDLSFSLIKLIPRLALRGMQASLVIGHWSFVLCTVEC